MVLVQPLPIPLFKSAKFLILIQATLIAPILSFEDKKPIFEDEKPLFEDEKPITAELDHEKTTEFKYTFKPLTTTLVPRDEDGCPLKSKYFTEGEIKLKLKKFKIIPDVIDEAQAPKIPCELMYSKLEPKLKGTHAVFGNKLETAIVRYEPFYVEWPTKLNEEYTLIMISPDYPTRKNASEKEYLHWMSINIPESFVTSGGVMAEYVETVPKPKTGYHRYVVLIFKQEHEVRVWDRLHSVGDDPSRPRFNTRKFMEQQKFKKVYAINFFESKYTNDTMIQTTTPDPTDTTTDTPYPHAGFTWFPITEPPLNPGPSTGFWDHLKEGRTVPAEFRH